MENENVVIYGLEFQARTLAAQLAETEKVRFVIGTQSLKQAHNQVHLLEFNEDTSAIKTSVFHHTRGEIWKITTSPLDPLRLATCHNAVTSENSCRMKTGIYRFPEDENPDAIEHLKKVTKLDLSTYKADIKTTEFHPTDAAKVLSVIDTHLILWDVTGKRAKSTLSISLEGKNSPKFTNGKWNPHQNCNQFSTVTETHVKTYDIRSGDLAWSIDGAHSQLIRDLDFNMNKQYHLATCGDDGFVKIWDFRQPSAPIFSRSDHSHWVWCVRFNHFHDQLILTSSSDARVLLSSAASVSSESNASIDLVDEGENLETKQMCADGPLQWCEHEDSVYCAEWSPAEPWIFASLSYDGRLLISHVKKSIKYQIIL